MLQAFDESQLTSQQKEEWLASLDRVSDDFCRDLQRERLPATGGFSRASLEEALALNEAERTRVIALPVIDHPL